MVLDKIEGFDHVADCDTPLNANGEHGNDSALEAVA